jgi:hypothetical protein
MTLGILIATSSGIVICTDSLVTTSKTHTVLKDLKNEIDLPREIWESVNEGEFGYATPNSNLTTTDTIISTSPNVKKMFQIGKHSIAFTLAGENHWKYTKFNKNGLGTDFPVPMESYVDTVVQHVINELPESSSFEDIVNCLSFVLNYGQLHGNQNFSQNKKSSIYSIMGGGYGENDSYPRVFMYKMPGGTPKQSALNACSRTFSAALSASFIQSCFSTNWFDQYCAKDMVAAIDAAHSQAWVWGVHYGWSPQTIIEDLIPDVNYNIINCLTVLNDFTSDDPHAFLQLENLSTPVIISRLWNSYCSSKSMADIEDLVSKVNNITPQMLEIIKLENPVKLVTNFKNRVLEYIWELYPVGYEEQSENIKKSITSTGFNAMWGILNHMIPSFMHSLSQISGKTNSESIHFAQTMWTGLEYVGSAEVIEKITEGMDAETYWNLSKDIKSYQMHAAERLATIISNKIQSKDVPEYIPYGKEPEHNGGEEELSKSENPLSHTQLKLPIPEQVISDTESSEKSDISGQWKGFYTRVSNVNGTINKFQFELEILQSGAKIFVGECSPNSSSKISLSNGRISDGEKVQFEMTLDGNQLTQFLVDCEIKAWGIEGSFEFEGKPESLIMHRNDSTDYIDSEKLTSEALNQLVRELERVEPKIKSWEVNFTNLPLESAVKMAHYLMNSTVMKQRFNQELPSVGGPIRTLVITRDGGVKSIQDYQV